MPPELIRKALIFDVVLCILLLVASFFAPGKTWQIGFLVGALAFVLDAINASRILDQHESD
ncbi:MAG: hypothetical protein GY914_00340 [Prochlorococcus sp.]|nr:hypothetical protein [Prochlorococcus sp.]